MTRPDIKSLIPKKPAKVIFACLNWGLGHASRTIPIIQFLKDTGHEVIIASDGEAMNLLEEAFPNNQIIELPAYNVRYVGKGLFSIILFNMLRVLKAIIRERRYAEKLVRKFDPDLIISDSRFGFRSGHVRSVIISHQLNLKVWKGVLGWVMDKVNERLLNKFNAVWIPDTRESTLSGRLSINPRIKNQYFIGPISRLEKIPNTEKYSVALLLSGPENARTKLERRLIDIFSNSTKNIVLVRGTTKGPKLELGANWTVYNRIDTKLMNQIISASKHIISRSGYSSIMDYYHLGRGAFIIPTPGQAEQLYLAKHLNHNFNFRKIMESELGKLKVLA